MNVEVMTQSFPLPPRPGLEVGNSAQKTSGIFVAFFCAMLGGNDVAAHHGGAELFAPIVAERITIDGDLGDWPSDLQDFQISNSGAAYGPTDLETGSPEATRLDLDARFRIGWAPAHNRLYVGVSVVDDHRVVGTGPTTTDGCEIYIDGAHLAQQASPDTRERILAGIQVSPEDLACQQYYLVPGDGTYEAGAENPGVKGGRFSISGAEAAYAVNGNRTSYEWALPILGEGKRELTLQEGMTIGFDIGIADKDAEADSSAWLTWAPVGYLKFLDASLLGDVILVNDYRDLGQVELLVTDNGDTPVSGLVLEWFDGDGLARRTVTNREGRVGITVRAGRYVIGLRKWQGYRATRQEVLVAGGEENEFELRVDKP